MSTDIFSEIPSAIHRGILQESGIPSEASSGIPPVFRVIFHGVPSGIPPGTFREFT